MGAKVYPIACEDQLCDPIAQPDRQSRKRAASAGRSTVGAHDHIDRARRRPHPHQITMNVHDHDPDRTDDEQDPENDHG